MNKALIIVDVQNDFFPGGGLPVPNADLIIPIINHIGSRFECVIATQDMHPENHYSFKQWGKHCICGTWGSRINSNLNLNIDKIVTKGTKKYFDSYSGFYNKIDEETDLNEYLKEKEIKEIFVCGLVSEICVRSTILDSLKFGYKTNIVMNACKELNINNAINFFKEIKGSVNFY